MSTPPIKYETVPIDTVSQHPRNVRKHVTKHIVRESLDNHAQYKPLVVQRSTGRVLAGNGTLEVMQEMGLTEVDVRYLDVDDDEALQILLIDNRSSDDSGYDDQALATLLTELSKKNKALLDGTGYNDLEVANLLHRLARPEEASDFLNAFMGSDDGDAPPVAVNIPGQGTLFRISYLVSGDDRTAINDAIKAAKDEFDVGSAAEAVAEICRAYLS